MIDMDFKVAPKIFQSQITENLKIWDFDLTNQKLELNHEKNVHLDETRCVVLKKNLLATGSKVQFN